MFQMFSQMKTERKENHTDAFFRVLSFTSRNRACKVSNRRLNKNPSDASPSSADLDLSRL